MIGGGGGGGYQNAGGGGAGGYRHIASHPVPASGHAVSVGEFGQGNGHGPSTSPGDTINLRNGTPTTFAAGSLAVGGGGSGGNEGPGGGSAKEVSHLAQLVDLVVAVVETKELLLPQDLMEMMVVMVFNLQTELVVAVVVPVVLERMVRVLHLKVDMVD